MSSEALYTGLTPGMESLNKLSVTGAVPWDKNFDLDKGLRQLLRSPEFYEIQAIRPRLNVFEALGVKWREHSHSDLLAYLLSPNNGHGLGDLFLREFLFEAFSARPLTEGRDDILDTMALASFSMEGVQVYREWRNIDLVIQLPKMDMVVGVENKIFAAEQESQIERYQDILAEQSSSHALIVFLTPGRGQTQTGKCGHKTPCVHVGWENVIGVLEEIDASTIPEDAGFFIDQVIHHLRADIMGQSREKEIVAKLLSNPSMAKTIQKIRQHAPKLQDCWNAIDEVAKRLFSGFEIERYPEKRGEIAEIKITPAEGVYPGYRPVFMVYHYPAWHKQPFPGIFLAASSAGYVDLKDTHEKLAEHADRLDSKPAYVPEWGWLNLLSRQNDVTDYGVIIEDVSFGDNFVRTVEDQFEEFHKIISQAFENIKEKQ